MILLSVFTSLYLPNLLNLKQESGFGSQMKNCERIKTERSFKKIK